MGIYVSAKFSVSKVLLNESSYYVHDFTAEWLNKVCYDVATEPPLQQLSGEAIVPMTANRQDEARADIHTHGF